MTSATFRRLVIRARNSMPRLTRETMRRIDAVYVTAADQVAKRVAAATMAGHAEITATSLSAIERQLAAAASDIAAAIETRGVASLHLAVEKIGTVNDTFISEVFNKAGVDKVDRAVVAQLVSAVDEQVVASVVNRIWQDGYTFSRRCWRAGQRFQDDIRNVLSAGLAQGRDVLTIAKDIQVYTRDGRVRLMQRYGGLERGTREFAMRIPKNVDYRALRLVRTELYGALRDAGVEHGRINPAGKGLWDWVRQSSVDWACDCPEFARDSPYTLEALPGTPHANCLCSVVPRLENAGEFQDRLRAWADGAPDAGLDEWYDSVYLPEAA